MYCMVLYSVMSAYHGLFYQDRTQSSVRKLLYIKTGKQTCRMTTIVAQQYYYTPIKLVNPGSRTWIGHLRRLAYIYQALLSQLCRPASRC